MRLGDKILKLRKQKGLSQEQLGERIDVTRQTVSNWELGETSPNPEQLKKLSNVLNISIDELLDNNINSVLVDKVSNTEKLAGLIIKILKFIGITFIIYLMFCIVALIVFSSMGKLIHVESSAKTICSMDGQKYQIEFGSGNYFKCDGCNKQMNVEIKKLVNFNNIGDSMKNIENYFELKNGNCE